MNNAAKWQEQMDADAGRDAFKNKTSNMTQQEIFKNMTKGELSLSAIGDYHTIYVKGEKSRIQVAKTAIDYKKGIQKDADAAAIVSSWNATYGQGINPESVELTNKGLADLIKWVELTAMPILKSYGHDEEILPKGFDKWKEALTAASLKNKFG